MLCSLLRFGCSAGSSDPAAHLGPLINFALRFETTFLVTCERLRQTAQDTTQKHSITGRHIDFDTRRYQYYFGEQVTYEQWKKLPRGVRDNPRTGTGAYVVSLTSWPPRTREGTPGIWITIESLMRQTVKPDRIILWLTKEEYPDGDKTLPQTLVDLKARGLEIRWTQKNRRALTKLLPALEAKIPANIITVDDDMIYHRDWLKWLQTSHKQHPEALHAGLTRCLRVIDGQTMPYHANPNHTDKSKCEERFIHEGVLGVVYPYDNTNATCYGLDWRVLSDVPAYVSPTDDLWFWLCRVLAGTPLYTLGYTLDEMRTCVFLAQPLFWENAYLGRNDAVLRRLFTDFPVLSRALGLDLRKPQCVPQAFG
jgi:hypothetical protein